MTLIIRTTNQRLPHHANINTSLSYCIMCIELVHLKMVTAAVRICGPMSDIRLKKIYGLLKKYTDEA